jgi:hypothetical protein
MIALWLRGKLSAEWRRFTVAAIGVATAASLVGLVGVHAISSGATMTSRALAVTPVDWQVALGPGADLPNADAMFQVIGPQRGLAPTAPPDDVVLLPMDQWTAHFERAVATPGGGARLQIHARLDRTKLPTAPDVAYRLTTGLAKNVEVRAAGAAMIGDDLSARLDAVRQDAIFARVLMLFLGLPGAALALALVTTLVRAGSQRRRRENALLALRGARLSQIGIVAAVEAVALAAAGAALGVLGTVLLARGLLHVDLAAHGVIAWLAGTGIGVFVLASFAAIAPALGFDKLQRSGHALRFSVATSPWSGRRPMDGPGRSNRRHLPVGRHRSGRSGSKPAAWRPTATTSGGRWSAEDAAATFSTREPVGRPPAPSRSP